MAITSLSETMTLRKPKSCERSHLAELKSEFDQRKPSALISENCPVFLVCDLTGLFVPSSVTVVGFSSERWGTLASTELVRGSTSASVSFVPDRCLNRRDQWAAPQHRCRGNRSPMKCPWWWWPLSLQSPEFFKKATFAKRNTKHSSYKTTTLNKRFVVSKSSLVNDLLTSLQSPHFW